MRYDIAIIGTGPAGVEAAITAKVRNKTVLLLGSPDLSPKMRKAEKIMNYAGFPAVSGADLCNAMKSHLASMDITVTSDRIAGIYAMGDYFALQGTDIYEATAVILAAGVVPGRQLPGEDALLGQGVSYCATCDAPLYRGKEVAVVGYSREEEEEARFLGEVCSHVRYLPMYKGDVQLPGIEVVHDQPQSLEKTDAGIALHCAGGDYTQACVFILRESISPAQLVPGIETENGHVKVDHQMRTSIPGLFACGDVTGQPYQYIKAAGEGNVAALSAVSYLAKA